MSVYPPYPFFTLIGFFIHAVAFSAISYHFFAKRETRSFLYLALATGVDALNFWLIIALFYFFPNTEFKTQLFFFNAFLWKPFVSIFALMALITLKEKFASYVWVFFAVALVGVAVMFANVWETFWSLPPEYAYVHPVYPEIAAVSESSGIVGALAFSFFFLYHAFSQSLFVRRRSLILAAAAATWGLSALYWTASDPFWYILTHAVGMLGSILAAIGVLAFHPRRSVSSNITESL